MKFTTRQISDTIKKDTTLPGWVCSVYNDALVGERRKLKFLLRGHQMPEAFKDAILISLKAKFKDVENIESMAWKKELTSNLDYLRIIKKA
jgi:hypothetical protein